MKKRHEEQLENAGVNLGAQAISKIGGALIAKVVALFKHKPRGKTISEAQAEDAKMRGRKKKA
jgi:hypothetical protein